MDINDITIGFKPAPLFPKSLRQEAAAASRNPDARNQILTGVSIMNSEFREMNTCLSFDSKFFRPKTAPKPKSGPVPTCINWFSKVLRPEERVFVCSTVDRDIIRSLQQMQLKCRENKQLALPELISVGFQLQIQKPLSTGFSFRSGEKREERPEVVDNELELLEFVRFTETNEELDTVTVH